jgi:hypothetical protein
VNRWVTLAAILAFVVGLWTSLLVIKSPEQQGLVVPYGTGLCYDPTSWSMSPRRVFPCDGKGGPAPLLLVSDPAEVRR